MKFHARLHPGRVTDLSQPLEVRVHQPRKAADVTIKVWELDAFLGADGKPRREGTPDDLLATFVGSIEPAPPGGGRKPDWRAFKVASATIEPAPSDALMVKLRFPGSDTVYDVPILSEAAEVEGTEYELGLSIELGGAEQFRSKAPTLVRVPRIVPRLTALHIVGFDDDGEPIRDDAYVVPACVPNVALALASAEDADDAHQPAPVVGQCKVHPSGILTSRDVAEAVPLGLSLRRPLIAIPYGDKHDPAHAPRGLGLDVQPDGTIELLRPDTAMLRTMFAAGTKVERGTVDGHERMAFSGLVLRPAPSGTAPLATGTITPRRRRPARRGRS